MQVRILSGVPLFFDVGDIELSRETDINTSVGGVKFDGEKIRTELFPVKAFMDVSEILTFGAQKYDDRNWEKGMDWSRLYGACLRHLFAWWNGEDIDPESGRNHLAHAACDLVFLLEFLETHPELDDRPQRNIDRNKVISDLNALHSIVNKYKPAND